MATQSLLTLRSTLILLSDFSTSVVAMSTGKRTTGDLDSTEQRPTQAIPIDSPGYDCRVWCNVTRQRFRSPGNDRLRLDSCMRKQNHGWIVWDEITGGFRECKIRHPLPPRPEQAVVHVFRVDDTSWQSHGSKTSNQC